MRGRGITCLALIFFISSGPFLRAAPVLADVTEKNYSVDPDSKITIRNTDGSILIYGAATNEIKIWASKKAFGRERLGQISVDVSVKPGEVSIETRFPPRPKWGLGDRSGTVDYVIVLPWTCRSLFVELVNGEVLLDGLRGGTTEATLANGRLFAQNCFTDLRVNVGTGGFDIRWEWWESGKFSVVAAMENGNLRAHVPADAGFHLLASSATGKVTTDLLQLDREQEDPRTIDGTVGQPSPVEMKLKATDGNIIVSALTP